MPASTSLIKIGTGMLILTGANNTYSGGTTVSGGILMANNTAGSATGSGAVAVNSGGTLAGTGIISGAVTVNSGGALAPGNPLGTLTISNNLTLAAGSTTFMQVQHSPLTNNAVKISGTLTEGGTLNVTNIGATRSRQWRQLQAVQRGELFRRVRGICFAAVDGQSGLEHERAE